MPPEQCALIVVDVQRDFLPGGALAVHDGDAVVPLIAGLIPLFGPRVAFTRDWHPPGHASFAARGGPWPAHCVQGTPGADMVPWPAACLPVDVFSKGTDPDVEQYSGFGNPALGAWLDGLGVRRVYVAGLAFDYCVKATACDARRYGFEAFVVADACRSASRRSADVAAAAAEMIAAGVDGCTADVVRDSFAWVGAPFATKLPVTGD